jgi:hypothetical protein
MPRLRTTSGLSLVALLAAVTGTAWLTELTYGPANTPLTVPHSVPATSNPHRQARRTSPVRWYPVQRVIDAPAPKMVSEDS